MCRCERDRRKGTFHMSDLQVRRGTPGLDQNALGVSVTDTLVCRFWGINGSAKRALDITLAVLALVSLLPLLIIVFAIARLDGGSGLFVQDRIGRAGRTFRMYKFRTMHPDAAALLANLLETNAASRDEWNQFQKLRRDPRITPFGQFLRASSIDELPQLINILKGDMSLVGPRPIVQSEVERYGRAYPAYCSVAPGLTGVWQVEGRSDTTYAQRVALDVNYAETWSVRGDLAILLKTIPAVLRGRGAQ